MLSVAAPGVLGNDSDPDGESLTAQLVSTPSAGAVVFNSNGSFDYSPSTDYYGSDSFTYQACDPTNRCTQATANITINPVNDPPVARDDTYTTLPGQQLVVNAPGLLANDYDVDSASITVAGIASGPANGTLIDWGLDGWFIYEPNPGFVGQDTFTYVIQDDQGATSSPAPVIINVVTLNARIQTTAQQRFVVVNQGVIITWTWQGQTYSAQSNIAIWPRGHFIPLLLKK